MNIIPLLVSYFLLVKAHGCQFDKDNLYSGTFADCSRSNLSRIPADLPANTTSLDLSHNNISDLFVHDSKGFHGLKYLDVSYNNLSYLNESLAQFTNLQELYLNNNKLTLDYRSYPIDVFEPLHSLIKIHLHNNDQRGVGSYPEEAIANLRTVRELKIDTFERTEFGYGFSKLFNLERFLLGFTNCKLAHIQNKTFEKLQNLPLVLLDLSRCPIVKLDIGCFHPLKTLKYLSISDTKDIKPTEAVLAMYGFRGRNLSSIEMNQMFTVKAYKNELVSERILSNEYLLHISHVCVEKFTMVNNQLLWIGIALIKETRFAKCIKHLDLSMNDFYGDITYTFLLPWMPNLVYLNVSRQGRILTASDSTNIQHTKRTIGITVPNTLKIVSLNGIATNQIHAVSNLHFFNTTSLRYVSFASNGLNGFTVKIHGLEHITYLDISGNNCSGISPSLYKNLPNLESLSMEDVNFGDRDLLDYGKQLFSPMAKLRKLNLSKNNIRLLETDIFSSSSLEEILLLRNRFESIPFDLMTTPYLHHLDLSFNSLAVLSVREMKLLDNLASRNNLTLNLEGNVLSCGCDKLDFILWLYNTEVKVIRSSSYICQTSDGSIRNTSYVRDHHEEIWSFCIGRMALSVTVTLLSLYFLLNIVMYLALKRKTWLINVFLRMFGYGPLPNTLKKTDFPNDAYIGYSDTDYQYVCHTVRHHLENRHGLKLFIRDRDTIPGGQIADDIISGIDSSWRTVLFLTAAFLGDEWCRFTVNRVVYSSARKPPGSILLLLFGDVTRGDIDPALLNVVDENCIIYIDSYTGGEESLWLDVSKRINHS